MCRSHTHPSLPPANEVWGKVMFLQVSVILFTGGCLVPGGVCLVPGEGAGPRGGAWSGGCLQAHTQRGSWGGSGPGPHPRRNSRGIWSRPTPKGELEWDLVQVHPPPLSPVTATALGGTHPTGMHSCWSDNPQNIGQRIMIPDIIFNCHLLLFQSISISKTY